LAVARFAALAVLTASFLLPGPAAATPLLDQQQNGSFEDWNATCTVPTAWTVEVGTVTCSALATDGARSAQLRAMPDEFGNHVSVLAQAIPPAGDDSSLPILPGLFYELQFDVIGGYNGKGNGSATLTWVGVLGHVLRVDTFEIPEAFVHFEQHYQAPIDPLVPDAATSVVLRFKVDGQSSDDKVNLWVDNVHFGLSGPMPLPPPAPG